jgi:predicted amidophosphoribosyltransferase
MIKMKHGSCCPNCGENLKNGRDGIRCPKCKAILIFMAGSGQGLETKTFIWNEDGKEWTRLLYHPLTKQFEFVKVEESEMEK